jgi:hypothetical protein
MIKNKKVVLTALFIALGLTLPMITANVPMIGNMLLPMHFPIIICGLICGAGYGALAGVITPLLRSFIFGMPPLFPIAAAMAFELAAYGAVAGLVYVIIQKNKGSVYPALIISMLSGKAVWGVVTFILFRMMGKTLTLQMFLAGAFTNAIPGIVGQLIIIPVLMYYLAKHRAASVETL